jgi:hypothetical protein
MDNSALTLSGGAGVAYDDLIRAGSNFIQRGYTSLDGSANRPKGWQHNPVVTCPVNHQKTGEESVPKDLVTALFEKWEGGDFMEQLSEIASLVSVGVPLTP